MNPFKFFLRLKSIDRNLKELLRLQRFNLDRDNLAERGIAVPAKAHQWWTGIWEIIDLPLRELKSYEILTNDGTPVPLSETPLYLFLKTGDETHLRRYIELHDRNGKCLTKASYEPHRRSLAALRETLSHEPYSPGKRVIVVDNRNAILDGTHRSSCLLALHGAELKITVLRILPASKSE